MKYKRYKKVKKAIIAGASSGIVAGMLIMGVSNTALAETTDMQVPSYSQSAGETGMHMMRRWNSTAKAGNLALQLGLDKNLVRAELKQGKTMKQILQENGIVPEELQKAFESKRYSKHMWKSVKNPRL